MDLTTQTLTKANLSPVNNEYLKYQEQKPIFSVKDGNILLEDQPATWADGLHWTLSIKE